MIEILWQTALKFLFLYFSLDSAPVKTDASGVYCTRIARTYQDTQGIHLQNWRIHDLDIIIEVHHLIVNIQT